MSAQSHPDPDKPTPLQPMEGSSNGDWLRLDSSPGGTGPRRPFGEAPEPVAFPDVPGYEILGELGRGGMGVVFKARHVALKRLVALKMISDSHFSSTESKERFRAEAEELARLQHSNIVQIYDIGEAEGRPFLALEYLEGGTLAQWMSRLPPSPHQAATLLEPLARAIQHAHDHGVVHRDLKPGNILLGNTEPTERVLEAPPTGSESEKKRRSSSKTPPRARDLRTLKIVDFGLVKKVKSDGSGQTRSGMVVGTPQYMAPEQATGEPAAAAPSADIYSLGAILYEMLTGHPPFEGGSTAETLVLLQTQEPIPPRRLRPKIPGDLETICLNCLEKDPSRRYASAAELADDLKRFLADEPIRAHALRPLGRLLRWRRRNKATAFLLALVIVMVLSLAAFGPFAAIHYLAVANSARASLEAADVERDEAKQQADESRRKLIRLNEAAARIPSFDREPGKSLLFFANAIRLAHANRDKSREDLNRVCFRNWLNRVCVPVHALAALPPDSPPPRAWAFHPAGRWILVQTRERVHLWDISTERELPFPGNVTRALSAAWSPDGETLAIGLDLEGVRLHRFPSGEEIGRVKHPGTIIALRFDETGRWLALGGEEARVWDLKNNRFAGPALRHRQSLVVALTFSPKGDRLATGCRDGLARVFEVGGSMEPVLTVPWRTSPDSLPNEPLIQPPLFAQGGQYLISLQPDRRQVKVWDLASKKEHWAFPSSTAPPEWRIDCCDAAAGGGLLALGGPAGARVIDLTTKRNFYQSSEWLEPSNQVLSASLDSDSGALMTGGTGNNVQLWSKEGRAAVHPLPAFRPVIGAAILQSGRLFVTMEDDGFIRAWSPPRISVSHFQTPRLSTSACVPVQTPDGKFFLTAGLPTGSPASRVTRTYGAESGLPAGPVIRADGAIQGAALSPLQDVAALAVSAASVNHIELWNWRSGRRILGPLSMPSEPRALAFSADGVRLGILCAAGQIMLLDPASGNTLGECAVSSPSRNRPEPTTGGGRLRFSPDGRFLVAWGLDSKLYILDVATCKQSHAIEQGDGTFTQIEFVPSTNLVVAAHDRRDAASWDLATGHRFTGNSFLQTERVATLRFDADGRALLTAGPDGQLRLWDWGSGRQLCPPMQHSGEIVGADFLPGDRWLFTVCADGALRLWDRETGQPASPIFNRNPGRCQNAVLAGAGRVVLVGGADGTVYGHALNDLTKVALTPAAALAEEDQLGQAARLISGYELADDTFPTRLSREAWLRQWRDGRGSLNDSRADLSGEYRAALAYQAERFEKNSYWPRAEQLWDDILQIDPNDFGARMARGRCAAERGDFARAIADHTAVLLLAPHLTEARACRALAFAHSGRSGVAFADLDRLLGLEPNHVLGLSRRGELLAAVGRFDEASRDLKMAADLGANHVSTWLQLAILQARADDMTGYRDTCKRSLQRFASSTDFAVRLNLARLLLLAADSGMHPAKAVELLDRCCDEQAANATAQNWRAYALVRAGREADASKSLEQVAKSVADEPQPWFEFINALVQKRRGDPNGAVKSFRAGSDWLDRVERGQAKNPDLTPLNAWAQREELRLMRREVETALAKP